MIIEMRVHARPNCERLATDAAAARRMPWPPHTRSSLPRPRSDSACTSAAPTNAPGMPPPQPQSTANGRQPGRARANEYLVARMIAVITGPDSASAVRVVAVAEEPPDLIMQRRPPGSPAPWGVASHLDMAAPSVAGRWAVARFPCDCDRSWSPGTVQPALGGPGRHWHLVSKTYIRIPVPPSVYRVGVARPRQWATRVPRSGSTLAQ